MVSIADICEDFWSKEPKGVSLPFTETLDHKYRHNLKTVVQDHTVYLVGYDWAVYAGRNFKRNHSIYYSEWESYSTTTKRHINHCDLKSQCTSVVLEKMPTINIETGEITW